MENMPLAKRMMSPGSKASHSSPHSWKCTAAVSSATNARHVLYWPSRVTLPLSRSMNLAFMLFCAAGTMFFRGCNVVSGSIYSGVILMFLSLWRWCSVFYRFKLFDRTVGVHCLSQFELDA